MYGRTPLWVAAAKDSMEVQALIKAQANVHKADKYGDTSSVTGDKYVKRLLFYLTYGIEKPRV